MITPLSWERVSQFQRNPCGRLWLQSREICWHSRFPLCHESKSHEIGVSPEIAEEQRSTISEMVRWKETKREEKGDSNPAFFLLNLWIRVFALVCVCGENEGAAGRYCFVLDWATWICRSASCSLYGWRPCWSTFLSENRWPSLSENSRESDPQFPAPEAPWHALYPFLPLLRSRYVPGLFLSHRHF